MSKSKLDPKVLTKLEELQDKFGVIGEDLLSYLDGLLFSDYLNYWDYIHLDTLLSLQVPKTHFPDEKIFIVYHQITELYFNLILTELEQLGSYLGNSVDYVLPRVKRVNRYFNHLVDSFDIMVDGMDRQQFLCFRMALLPASGFQSAQYRLIEICSTELTNLVAIKQAIGN